MEETPAAPTTAESDVTVPAPPSVEVEVAQVETASEPAPIIAITTEEQEVPAEPVIILSTELKEPGVPIESPVCCEHSIVCWILMNVFTDTRAGYPC